MSHPLDAEVEAVLRAAGITEVPMMQRHHWGDQRPGFVIRWRSELPRKDLPGWGPDEARFGSDPDEHPIIEQHVGWRDPAPADLMPYQQWIWSIVREAPAGGLPVEAVAAPGLPLLPPAPRMTGAEFRTARERLGLATRWVAETLGVAERSVHRWEADQSPVPAGVAIMVGYWAGQAVRLRHALDADSEIVTYRTDADMHEARPDLAYWPASWHRAVAGEAAAMRGEVRIEFWGGGSGIAAKRVAVFLGAPRKP